MERGPEKVAKCGAMVIIGERKKMERGKNKIKKNWNLTIISTSIDMGKRTRFKALYNNKAFPFGNTKKNKNKNSF